jgi:hypothetical protein
MAPIFYSKLKIFVNELFERNNDKHQSDIDKHQDDHSFKKTTMQTARTVFVIGKGESAKPVEKTDDNIIVTINHALAFQKYSDIHFHLDWYFETVPPDFFCRAKILVMPTYFHHLGSKHIHASVWLSKLHFDGPIFLIQLPDGPKDPNIEMWSGSEFIHSSGDFAFAWLLSRGYRRFESYGIGGTKYANYYTSERFIRQPKFVQNTKRHQAHIQERIDKYGATWIKHLKQTTTDKKRVRINLGPCLSPSGWGNLQKFGPTIPEARRLGGGDPGVDTRVLTNSRNAKAYIPRLKSVVILNESSTLYSLQENIIVVSIDEHLETLDYSGIHFQFNLGGFDALNFTKTGILVVPTYIESRGKYVSVEHMLSKLTFRGPIFKIQLDAGPQEKYIEKLKGNDKYQLARQWIFNRGYRIFL